MDRLTKLENDRLLIKYINHSGAAEWVDWWASNVETIQGALMRLLSFESTGLTPEQVAEFQAENARLKLEMDQAKNKVFGLFEKSNKLCDEQSAFIEELQGRLSTAEKVCSAAYMYIKHINSPLCVGWDLLLDALRKWTDERRPRGDGG